MFSQNEDKEEMKEILEMKRRHDRNLKKREGQNLNSEMNDKQNCLVAKI